MDTKRHHPEDGLSPAAQVMAYGKVRKRTMTDQEAAAVLVLVKGGWLKLELTDGE